MTAVAKTMLAQEQEKTLVELYQDVATSFYTDYSWMGQANAGLLALNKFCTSPAHKDDWEKRYTNWRKAYDLTLKACCLPKKLPPGEKWENLLEGISDNQFRTLIAFSDATSEGRVGISDLTAQPFLYKFYKNCAPAMQGIICKRAMQVVDDSIPEIGSRLQAFWRKHADELAELAEKPAYMQHHSAINSISELATDRTFAYRIRNHTVPAEKFTIDAATLESGLKSGSAAVQSLRNLDTTLSLMRDIADRQGSQERRKLQAIKEDFRSVVNALNNYNTAASCYRQEEQLLTAVCAAAETKHGHNYI